MLETSARLLELLSLLQLRRGWTGQELAERLGVSARTVRADVGRLRDLGYPVEARPGVAGGYRLSAGTAMPPLLLSDDEAVAVAVGLRSVAAQGVAGAEETTLTALAKLDQVLPHRLRRRVDAVRATTAVVRDDGPVTDPAVLGTVAMAVRWTELLRFDYTSADGATTTRLVEPRHLVCWNMRWYLAAWDRDRGDWRVFRVDRMTPRAPTGARFAPRPPPAPDVTRWVTDRVARATWGVRARVRVHAPADQVTPLLAPGVVAEPLDERTCAIDLGTDDPDRLALWLAALGPEVEVLEGRETAAAFRRLADRAQRAAGVAPA
ncbi:helix-turn-helix transcriptional regulator [Promicromonospora sp. NPDC050880]|uniref:helix-turn-helix transcriptional regulator n=1 Tax=Promicromonospora sp. NPDC050880 TaxID=3364406 RepID=UPI0037B7EED4